MTLLPLTAENRSQSHPRDRSDFPHLREVGRDPQPSDTLTREAFAREASARESRALTPVLPDARTWEADGREELGREVRAREALTRVGRGAPREISHDDLQLLRLLATGLPMDSVARRLDLSERTVRRRTRAACDRLGFGTAVEAIVWAARRGLL